ncbi:MAG: HTH domain-containing protein, partial [Candidatus Veblenbacteria bacterium]|nr:HTH domain-containing protein [Candidatus Veblenbacteria bacterium]
EEQGSILDKILATQQVSHRDNFQPKGTLARLLELLVERERQIIWRRFGLGGEKPETLENIGKSFRVTRERVRQIEQLAVSKLKGGARAQAIVKPLQQVVVEVLEGEGGAATDERLINLLGEVGDGANPNVLRFYLGDILAEVVAPLGGESTPYVSGWRLRTASLEALDTIVQSAQDIITARSVPLAEAELTGQLAALKLPGLLQGTLEEHNVILGLLQLSTMVRHNTFGEWGLKHWETINPRRMNDKIYLVLKKYGKPLHFKEIVKIINEQGFDRKQAYAPTVHNELILDDKFVLVGRGIYALKEWGYQPGVVADVIAVILKERGEPLGRDELVEAVLKQRLVKRGTVYLALTNRKKFTKLPDGRYGLAESAPKVTVI